MQKTLSGILALGAVVTACVVDATPAKALTFNEFNAYLSSTTTVGNSFNVIFGDSLVNSIATDLVSATANFTVSSINRNSAGNITGVGFNVQVANTSAIDSLVSQLGFNVGGTTLRRGATGYTIGSNNFNADFGTNFPAPIGSRDVSFDFNPPGRLDFRIPDGNVAGNPLNWSFNLALQDPVNTLRLGDFVVRFQEVNGTLENGTNIVGGSGVSQPIPTPALLPGLIGMGVAALRKKNEESDEAV